MDVKSKMTKLEIRAISTRTVKMWAHLPHWDMTQKEPDKAGDTSGRGDDTASKDFVDLCGVEKTPLAISRSQRGEREAKWQNGLPVPPETPPNSYIHPPGTIGDLHRHGGMKTRAKKVRPWQTQYKEKRAGGSPGSSIAPVLHPASANYVPKSSKGLRHHARLRSNAENKLQQAKRSMAIRNLATWDHIPGKEDNGGRWHGDATRSGYTDLCGVGESLLIDSGSQHSERKAKQVDGSPAPPVPCPSSTGHLPRLYEPTHRRGRVKLKAENVSNAHMRQNASHQAATSTLLRTFESTPGLCQRVMDGERTLQRSQYE
ncbi:hypothetical protein EDD16DRAFT_1733624 [Pisolithus croceorrhizus]|nr:hypothetical protein EDD16DRAFT_1733624 [Pisolithus croceorrhizus]KAI6096630.1 hypothetical protein EV401DRAFT_1895714 [Pisolithus croceorrhizus]